MRTTVTKNCALTAFTPRMIARFAKDAANVFRIAMPPKDGNIVINVQKP